MEKISKLKIGILGKREEIIFFKGLGFEIFPLERDPNEILKEIEKREDLGIVFVAQDLFSKIKNEILIRFYQRPFPIIISLSLKGKEDLSIELKEIMKRAVGKEIEIKD